MMRPLPIVFAVLSLASLAATAQDEAPSALQVIESNRGGRHWVDEATAPPKTPEESLRMFEIEPGYELSLYASEPLVRDPVSICFDLQGRMFVAEYGDYPTGPDEGESHLSRIVILDDEDQDGRADSRTVFADNLDFAHSMMAYKDGLLVGAKTKILYLRDTDGDQVADVRETLFDGFKPAHPQMQIGNPRWGIDNWVYLNYGPGSVTSASQQGKATEMPRKDFRFSPHTMEYESDSGMGQFGNTVDRWGNRFYCTNRNPIITTLLSPGQLAENPYHIVSRPFYDVAPSGGDSRVYPLVAMKSNYLSHAGTHTSACGTTAYLGELGDETFQNSVFVCEPIGHLVTRSVVSTDRVRFTASRARENKDFLASTDTWFRPASLATGPDGALYLADMYRLWVEHPKFLPPEIAAKLDWRAGDDRGRVYRIIPSGAKPRSFEPPSSDEQLVRLLDDENGWRQFLGQRLLVEQKQVSLSTAVRERLSHSSASTRLHALWTLDGLGALASGDVLRMLEDDNVHCRVAAVQLAAHRMDDSSVLDALLGLAGDESERVRFALALTLSGSDAERASDALVNLAISDGLNPTFADGLLTSVRERAGKVLARLVGNEEFIASADEGGIDLIYRLASIVGARGDQQELNALFERIGGEEKTRWWQSAAIAGLGNGLPRYRGEMGRLTLAKLLASPPAGMEDAIGQLEEAFQRNVSVAVDESKGIADRVAAIELLGYQPINASAASFEQLLSNDQPVQIQVACLEGLKRNGSIDAARIVLDRWGQLGPKTRGSAIEFLLRRQESVRMTLEAMGDDLLSPSALSIDQRVRLLKHSDADIRKLALELFGGAVSSNRQQVAKDYEHALSMEADVARGSLVFNRVCANCHRVDGKGYETGPDLTDVRNRSKPALLYDILDPNSKVEPRFTAYSILTLDGAVFTGLIESETSEAVVLRMAEGKSKTIGRAEIDQMKASDVSLMPEGVEKEISVEQMADLLAFLKNR